MFSKKTVIAGAISCLFLFSPVTMASFPKTPLNLHGIILGENQCIKEHYWLASHT